MPPFTTSPRSEDRGSPSASSACRGGGGPRHTACGGGDGGRTLPKVYVRCHQKLLRWVPKNLSAAHAGAGPYGPGVLQLLARQEV
eukprot:2640080-Amphidinium_carterae.1